MKNEEILRLAIEKTVGNGWVIPERGDTSWSVVTLGDDSVLLEYGDSYGMCEMSLNDIIFSHSFAKAYWGKYPKHTEGCCAAQRDIFKWEFHLQQMVLEPNPLKYLEKFLEKEPA